MPSTDIVATTRGVVLENGIGQVVGVVNPDTGETLMLGDDVALDQLAACRVALKEWIGSGRDASSILDEFIRLLLDRSAAASLEVGDLVVSAPRPQPGFHTIADPEGFRDALNGLVFDGVIDQGAVDIAIREKTVVAVDARGMTALRRVADAPQMEKLKAVIAEFEVEAVQARPVTIKRSGR